MVYFSTSLGEAFKQACKGQNSKQKGYLLEYTVTKPITVNFHVEDAHGVKHMTYACKECELRLDAKSVHDNLAHPPTAHGPDALNRLYDKWEDDNKPAMQAFSKGISEAMGVEVEPQVEAHWVTKAFCNYMGVDKYPKIKAWCAHKDRMGWQC